MGLDIHISTGSDAPIYRQIASQIRRAIAAGTLAAGEQLPSVRQLAETLVINPNTVARAYTELVSEGLLEGRLGKGYFIADRRGANPKPQRLRKLKLAAEDFINEAVLLECSPDEIREAVEHRLSACKRER